MATPLLDHIKPVTTLLERQRAAAYRNSLDQTLSSHKQWALTSELGREQLAECHLEIAALNHEIEMYDMTQKLLA